MSEYISQYFLQLSKPLFDKILTDVDPKSFIAISAVISPALAVELVHKHMMAPCEEVEVQKYADFLLSKAELQCDMPALVYEDIPE